jgi:hypothetical protein
MLKKDLKITLTPGKKTLEQQKKLQMAAHQISEKNKEEALFEGVIVSDEKDKGVAFLSTFSTPISAQLNRQRIFKEKLIFKKNMLDEVLVEAVANIFRAGLSLDEDFKKTRKAEIANAGIHLAKGYLNEKTTLTHPLLKNLSETAKPLIEKIAEEYFAGAASDVVTKKWNTLKENLISELLLEGYYIYDTVKKNTLTALVKEKRISEEINALQKDENERRLLAESNSGEFEEFSKSYKVKMDKLTRPTLFQTILEKVSQAEPTRSENDILAEGLLLYTMLETVSVLKLRNFETVNKFTALKELLELRK